MKQKWQQHSGFRWALIICGGVCAFLLLFLPSSVVFSTELSNQIAGSILNYLPLVYEGGLTHTPAPAEGPLLITEVMYDPESDEPGGEWVEIFNAGDLTLSLSDYKIGDEETPGGGEGMFRFPDGNTIDPGEVLVIANQAATFFADHGFLPAYEMRNSDAAVPTLVKHAAWAGGNVELVNSSDEVLLLGAGDQLVDTVSWGKSTFAFSPPAPDVVAGHSLERVPAYQDTDSSMDWQDQGNPGPGIVDLIGPTPIPSQTSAPTTPPIDTPTLTQTGVPSTTPTRTPMPQTTIPPTETPSSTQTPTPSTTPIIELKLHISEVMYDPIGQEPDGEWIEIFNPNAQAILLSEIKLGDEESPGGGEGMFRFPDGQTISAKEVIVVANQATAFFAEFGMAPDFEIQDSDDQVPDMVRYTSWASGNVSMGNTGEEVLLLGPADQIVDMLSWGNSNFAFDPPVSDVDEGHSLARQPADLDTDSATDWIDRVLPDPGNVNVGPFPSPTAMATSTFTNTPTPPATPTPGPSPTATSTVEPMDYLVITELFYDTPGSDSQEEWMEIYNPTSQLVDLGEYKLGDEETIGGGEGMYQFPPGATIYPGERLVIALRADGFMNLYGFLPDYEIVDTNPAVPDLSQHTSWGSGVIVLGNSGDEVLLVDETDQPVDVVVYEGGAFLGVIPHPGVASGHSIERFPPGSDTNDCSLDFIDQAMPSPGE